MEINWNAVAALSAVFATFFALVQVLIAARMQKRAETQIAEAQRAMLEAIDIIADKYGGIMRHHADELAQSVDIAAAKAIEIAINNSTKIMEHQTRDIERAWAITMDSIKHHGPKVACNASAEFQNRVDKIEDKLRTIVSIQENLDRRLNGE